MNFIVVALITGLAMSDTLEFVARSHRVAILSGLICVNDIGKSERVISPLYDRPLFAEFVRHHAKIGSVNPGAARRAGPEIQTRVRERLVRHRRRRARLLERMRLGERFDLHQ
jgi:hypothetical protein